jgi:hypothetical protein
MLTRIPHLRTCMLFGERSSVRVSVDYQENVPSPDLSCAVVRWTPPPFPLVCGIVSRLNLGGRTLSRPPSFFCLLCVCLSLLVRAENICCIVHVLNTVVLSSVSECILGTARPEVARQAAPVVTVSAASPARLISKKKTNFGACVHVHANV